MDQSDLYHPTALGIACTAPELLPLVFVGPGRSQHHGAAALRAGRYGPGRRRMPGGLIALAFPLGETGGSKLLAVPALFNEGCLQRGNLPVEQVVRLMDQADDRIGPNLGTLMLQPESIQHPALLVSSVRSD